MKKKIVKKQVKIKKPDGSVVKISKKKGLPAKIKKSDGSTVMIGKKKKAPAKTTKMKKGY